MKEIEKVKILKSVEGSEFKEVILDKELVIALSEWSRLCLSTTWLYENDIKFDVDKINKISDELTQVFRKYKLDKYDVRANYKFDESTILTNSELSK